MTKTDKGNFSIPLLKDLYKNKTDITTNKDFAKEWAGSNRIENLQISQIHRGTAVKINDSIKVHKEDKPPRAVICTLGTSTYNFSCFTANILKPRLLSLLETASLWLNKWDRNSFQSVIILTLSPLTLPHSSLWFFRNTDSI